MMRSEKGSVQARTFGFVFVLCLGLGLGIVIGHYFPESNKLLTLAQVAGVRQHALQSTALTNPLLECAARGLPTEWR